jgi:ring-1,2-phenylacetyl-CoA epoxidase subunit PaaC
MILTQAINNEVQTGSSGEPFDDSLVNFTLHLADNALVISQRNSGWCGHGPILEQDIAITNISLDLLGQARLFYQYAAELLNKQQQADAQINPRDSKKTEITEDTLAYFRTEREFKNCLLTEQPNGDWGQTILRQFFFSNYQFHFYTGLANSNDQRLAAIAVKSLKEVTYHLRWSSEWVIRLGDGTDESHKRMIAANENLWQFTGELFEPAVYETELINRGIAVDPDPIKTNWDQTLAEVFKQATLAIPIANFMQSGGKSGIHTEHMGYILAELQYLQRTYPGCNW